MASQQLDPSVVDIEMQQSESMQGSKHRIISDHGAHMDFLQILFGFTRDQMQQVERLPAITPWCRYLEGRFQPLMTDQYAGIWPPLGLSRPQTVSECWNLVRIIAHTIAELGDAEYSIVDVWRSAVLSPDSGVDDATLSDDVENQCFVATFAVLCWGGMILQPQLTWSGDSAAACLAVCQLPAANSLKIDFVRRPIAAVFRNLEKSLARRQVPRRHLTVKPTVLFVSTINYHSLQTIGKVGLKWVNDLSSHLDFDPRTRALSVFRFPSFCALTTIARDRGAVFEELVQTIFSTGDDSTDDIICSIQLCQEVLMSYRILFGQSSAARRLGKVLLRDIEGEHDYDELLSWLCTKSRRPVTQKLPASFWPVSCRGSDNTLQEVDSYGSRDDFPILGSRLAAIQEFNLRQQPSKLRDLWRDRRSPLQWYTFWAVLVVGGLSIILAMLQLAVAIIALKPS